MANVFPNNVGLVFIFAHDEVEDVINGAKALAGSGGLVTAALAAAGITAPAALVSAAISAYFGAQAWLIREVDRGNGVYLTVPWPAIFWGQWWLIIPTTRPTNIGAPEAWSERNAGEIRTEDGADLIGYGIERGVVDSQIVTFRLIIGGDSSGWRKIINLPDGEGNSWDLDANGRGATAENSLWANQVGNGQVLTFQKAKWFGAMFSVLTLGQLGGLQPGDRVTFAWNRD
jgi:hypothetical protein